MTETVAPEPTQEQAALLARVRRMMLIAALTTALAVAAVLIALRYRLFRTRGSAAVPPITFMLPQGARILSPRVARGPPGGALGVRGGNRKPPLSAPTPKT